VPLSSIEQVIVVPRNGYANRLQAWASSEILGQELRVPVRVLWDFEEIAPSSAESLFSPDLVTRKFISPGDFYSLFGREHQELPRYVYVDSAYGLVSFAGHDRGEQALIPQLMASISGNAQVKSLIIIAGGKFHLPQTYHFDLRRSEFYNAISWSAEIDQRVEQHLAGAKAYIGVHWRQTDRSISAPSHAAIQSEAKRLARQLDIQSVFVATDGDISRQQLQCALHDSGLETWTGGSLSFDRSSSSAGLDALIDWILLGHSQAIVYSADSSFGQEAALATCNLDRCIGLRAPLPIRALRSTNMRFAGLRSFLRRKSIT
jgi:hypothetical protein